MASMISQRVLFGTFVVVTFGTLAPMAQEAPKGGLAIEPVKRFGSNQFRHGSRIQCLMFAPPGAFPEAPDQALLVAGGGNDPIRVWNPETGERMRSIDFPWAQALAWNATERQLIAASAFRSIR